MWAVRLYCLQICASFKAPSLCNISRQNPYCQLDD
eukprot:UN13355